MRCSLQAVPPVAWPVYLQALSLRLACIMLLGPAHGAKSVLTALQEQQMVAAAQGMEAALVSAREADLMAKLKQFLADAKNAGVDLSQDPWVAKLLEQRVLRDRFDAWHGIAARVEGRYLGLAAVSGPAAAPMRWFDPVLRARATGAADRH